MISVLGSGAFGTALAVALARDGAEVTLWGRNTDATSLMQRERVAPHLERASLPDGLTVTSDLSAFDSDVCLIAVPAQAARDFLSEHVKALQKKDLIACSKGIDRKTGLGPVATIAATVPGARAFILTGPSFAADIARGAPTALLLAGESGTEDLQRRLSRPALRLYRSDDVIGAELGGALKNVIALAAGMAIGADFGDSARAALIARGFAEMRRVATAKNADLETIQGLSGLGDLVLTCTSEKSRNFTAGIALGQGERPNAGVTVEGIATAEAMVAEADRLSLDLPITRAVDDICRGRRSVPDAAEILLQRPLKEE